MDGMYRKMLLGPTLHTHASHCICMKMHSNEWAGLSGSTYLLFPDDIVPSRFVSPVNLWVLVYVGCALPRENIDRKRKERIC